MMHFEPDLAPATRTAPALSVEIREAVTVTPRPSQSRAFVAKTDDAWDWSDLRDYSIAQIEERFGPFPRDAKKEAGIFKSFLARHGEQASAIARFAFEVEGGYWAGAPISVNRFCKASDPYFADKIKPRLVDAPVKAW